MARQPQTAALAVQKPTFATQAMAPAESDASESTADTKKAKDCPGCGAAAYIRHVGKRWKVLCGQNCSISSACQKEGHTMYTRKEAVRCWNELE